MPAPPMSTFKILYFCYKFFCCCLNFEIFVQFETVNFVWLFGSPWNDISKHQLILNHPSPPKFTNPPSPSLPPFLLPLFSCVPMAMPLSMTSFLMAFVLKRDFRFAERVLWLLFMEFERPKWMCRSHPFPLLCFEYHLFKVGHRIMMPSTYIYFVA